MSGEVKVEVLKTIIYGVEKALWKGLEKASLVFTPYIGETICEDMSHLIDADLAKGSLDEIAKSIGKFMVEQGISKSFDIKIAGKTIEIAVKDCILFDVDRKLVKDGIKPFICPFLNATAYVFRKRLNLKSKIEDNTSGIVVAVSPYGYAVYGAQEISPQENYDYVVYFNGKGTGASEHEPADNGLRVYLLGGKYWVKSSLFELKPNYSYKPQATIKRLTKVRKQVVIIIIEVWPRVKL